MRYWSEVPLSEAVSLELPVTGIQGPLNEMGETCPWPWEPQQLGGAPMGQYHCPYCGAMVMAGMLHIDYADTDFGPPAVLEEGE